MLQYSLDGVRKIARILVGNSRMLPVLDLAEGVHTARLEVIDSDGTMASVKHQFTLAEAQLIYLPFITK